MPNIFKRLFSRKSENRSSDGTTTVSFTNGMLGAFTENRSLQLSTVYRCVDCISDAVAQLPIEIMRVNSNGYKRNAYDHPAYYLIAKEPNRRMSRYMMMKAAVSAMILKGNAYIYISRDDAGNAIGLEFLKPGTVTVIDDEHGHIMAYGHPAYGWIEPDNMIHLINFSTDGEHGMSTISYAAQAIELAVDSENHAKGFFKGGANLSGVVTVNSVLTQKQKKDFLASWYQNFDPNTGHPNGVAIMEADMDFKPITVNPADAQLLETRKYNVEDICRFFGVSPVKAYDLSKSSYSTIEATQLAFLTDTLQPLLEKIELEFERKVFVPSERFLYDVRFDTSSLIRTDKNALAEYYTKLFQLGVFTTNDIRRQLDLEPVEAGNQAFIQSNLVPIDRPLGATQAQQQPGNTVNGSNNQDEDDISSQGGQG
ncbi:phage portal protein [Prevotella sp. KH2C16]|uniref:phage portal protein n=1 Tax=Prevotella sp. KH2C16 TaxID=1855325 RepID=UPI0008F06C10|nr:phage portal protein [Prevotella sp. KH2C16]SFF96706.1 phage portal protein, HK97 family [Prevotella sp. KH2C16]